MTPNRSVWELTTNTKKLPHTTTLLTGNLTSTTQLPGNLTTAPPAAPVCLEPQPVYLNLKPSMGQQKHM